MQTITGADQIFQGLREVRNKFNPQRGVSGAGAWVRNAVIATCVRATESFLKKENQCRFSYSTGITSLRSPETMEMIRAELEDIFGHRKAWVYPDPNYRYGIIIQVSLD